VIPAGSNSTNGGFLSTTIHGPTFKQFREALGYSVKDFATVVHVDPTYLGLVESGERQPSPRWTRSVLHALSADLRFKGYLAGIEERERSVV